MASKYSIVRFIHMDKAVLQKENQYFLASFANVPFSGPEVLVFSSDAEGKVESWSEVDGGKGYVNLAEFLCEACLT